MEKMKVLVIGSGGREHALVWKISQSKMVGRIFCAPGNAGTAQLAENVPIAADNIAELFNFAKNNSIDLTVVGPEAPLVDGIVDEFASHGLKIFGPTKRAAQLEGSKAFAKMIMKKYRIPTAAYGSFTEPDAAIAYINSLQDEKCVVKADGLAAGKGVFVCANKEDAISAVNKIMVEKAFAESGAKIVVEEFLEGEEASMLAFSDGRNVQLMQSAQDHKRIFDNDLGENTGGMGAYSPAPIVDEFMKAKVLNEIIKPTIFAMLKEGMPYVGVIYAGLMIKDGKPKVLEFNARFGDPETQVILPRMESDLVEVMLACIDGVLDKKHLKWKSDACTCVVIAAGGYPGHYEKGKEISGLVEADRCKNAIVFHAGTKLDGDKVLTNGGRVLGVTALGYNIKESIENAYNAVSKIQFEGMQFRRDIGAKALGRK